MNPMLLYTACRMALQMTGSAPKVLLGPCDAASLHPDLQWLQQQLAGPKPPKMVVLVNPCNPTGGEFGG
jgi:aspartate/methionine/tyrosine aminotransferase